MSEYDYDDASDSYLEEIHDLKATSAKLCEALRALMQLVENGVLVRDTSRDGEAGWAIHQLPLLCALRMAQEALAGTEVTP